MKNSPSLVLGIAASALLSSLSFVARPAAQSAPPPAASAENDAAASLYQQTCGECHDSVRIVSKRRTKAEWQDVINKMIEEGATGSGKDFENIFGYLLRHYGKLFINSAPADQITVILGLTPKDADAITAYRTAKGAFADFDAIKQVPGIDTTVLEAHKDAVAF